MHLTVFYFLCAFYVMLSYQSLISFVWLVRLYNRIPALSSVISSREKAVNEEASSECYLHIVTLFRYKSRVIYSNCRRTIWINMLRLLNSVYLMFSLDYMRVYVSFINRDVTNSQYGVYYLSSISRTPSAV